MNRRGAVGGSDVAAILNVHPYKTALSVWAEKTGKVEPDETIADKPAVAWGNRLEATIIKHWSKLHLGRANQVDRGPACRVVHPHYDWFRGHIDGIPLNTKAGILEVKTAGIRQAGRWGPSGSSDPADVPIEYYCQAQSYLWAKFAPSMTTMIDQIVAEQLLCHIAVLIGGQDYRDYVFMADLELWKQFERHLPEFWTENVGKGIPPDPVAKDNPWMSALYDRVNRETILADNEISAVVGKLAKWKTVRKQADGFIDEIEAQIKGFMQDHAHLVDATGEPLVTWKCNDVTRLQGKELKKAHPDIYELFSKTASERRFLLKIGDDE